MSHTTCVYYSYPLDPNGDAACDKELHSPFRATPEEEPAEEDPGHRPLQNGPHSERRHRPWAYYQC
jgi:hypothetical protein